MFERQHLQILKSLMAEPRRRMQIIMGPRHQDRRSLQQAQRRHQGYRQGVSLTTPDIYERLTEKASLFLFSPQLLQMSVSAHFP